MKSPLYRRLAGLPLGRALLLAAILAGCSSPAVVHKPPALSDSKKPGEAAVPASRRTPAGELPPALTTKPMEPMAMVKVLSLRTLPTNVISNLELTDEADVATESRRLCRR